MMGDASTPVAQVWDDMWSFANAICAEIESWQPDLILVLHKAGAVPWHAAETLWRLTRTAPLPPLAAANIGREKDCFEGEPSFPRWDCAEPIDLGIFAARAVQQPGWAPMLRAQLHAAVGDVNPARILVVDDVVDDGATAHIALGLLWALYPAAQAKLVAGLPINWQTESAEQWLADCHPDVLARLQAEHAQGKAREPGVRLVRLVAGLAEVEGAPFATRPLRDDGRGGFNTDFPGAAALLAHLPVEKWLELPAWVCARVETLIQAGVTAQGSPRKNASGRAYPWCPTWVSMGDAEHLYMVAWLQRVFTVEDVMRCLPFSAADVRGMLGHMQVEEWAPLTRDGVSGYALVPKEGVIYFDLPAHPGAEAIHAGDIFSRRAVQTPFPVEWAATDPHFGDGPALAMVADGAGARVPAELVTFFRQALVDVVDHAARIMPELLTVPNPHRTPHVPPFNYHWVQEWDELGPLEAAFTCVRTPTLDFVLDPALPVEEKAERLADLAVASLSAETYRSGMDALTYLADALARGVDTPLTQPYAAALLRRADNAPTVAAAREWFARRAGLTGS